MIPLRQARAQRLLAIWATAWVAAGNHLCSSVNLEFLIEDNWGSRTLAEVVDKLWDCEMPLPQQLIRDIDLPRYSTYSSAVKELKVKSYYR